MSQRSITSICDDIQTQLQHIKTLFTQYCRHRVQKKKRNQKTRQQYKRRKTQAQIKAQQVTVQEVEQELKHLDVQIDVKSDVKSVIWTGNGKTGKHVVLQSWNVATLSHWHAVISHVGMASFGGMIMVQNGAIEMSRMGVG